MLQVESNPRPLRVLPSDEEVVLIGFELAIGQTQGMMCLCVPCRALERIGQWRSADGSPTAADSVVPSTVEMGVTLAETPIAADQLADLRVGDIIATETAADSPAVVSIEGIPRFHGRPGVYEGRKAIRLTKPIEAASPGRSE